MHTNRLSACRSCQVACLPIVPAEPLAVISLRYRRSCESGDGSEGRSPFGRDNAILLSYLCRFQGPGRRTDTVTIASHRKTSARARSAIWKPQRRAADDAPAAGLAVGDKAGDESDKKRGDRGKKQETHDVRPFVAQPGRQSSGFLLGVPGGGRRAGHRKRWRRLVNGQAARLRHSPAGTRAQSGERATDHRSAAASRDPRRSGAAHAANDR